MYKLLAATVPLMMLGPSLSYSAFTPVVWAVPTPFPAKSKIDAPSNGLISTVSTPLGKPVILKTALITVSPPTRAPPLVLVTLAMLAPVAFPPFEANVS
jgi:hypothetical protein